MCAVPACGGGVVGGHVVKCPRNDVSGDRPGSSYTSSLRPHTLSKALLRLYEDAQAVDMRDLDDEDVAMIVEEFHACMRRVQAGTYT